VDFDSLEIHDGDDGARRWEEAGRPVLPSVLVGGEATPILHVSQLAAALGLPAPAASEPTRAAWETLPLLRSWADRMRPLDLERLTAPTQSRGRSLRNLTVNVFHPFELLLEAWSTRRFPWEPVRDEERERALRTAADVVAYADRILFAWTDFVLEHADEFGRREPVVSSPRGDVPFSALLDSQLEHVSFHHEQLVAFRRGAG
jgi:hypothetical protein